MNKITKTLAAVLMLFSQLAYPIESIYADVVEEELTTVEYNFEVLPTISDTTVEINIMNTDEESKIVEEEDYILKSTLEFEKSDESIISEDKIILLSGSDIKNYNLVFNNIGINKAGKYNLSIEIYNTDDSLIDKSDSGLEEYTISKDNVYAYNDTIYENELIESSLIFSATGTGLSCTNKECTLDSSIDSNVTFNYTITGNSIEEEKLDSAYANIVINDSVTLDYFNTYDFSNLVKGPYKLTLNMYDLDNELLLTDSLTINYGSTSDNTNLEDYFDINDSTTKEQIQAMIISNSALDSDALEEFNINKEELEEMISKKPIDLEVSNLISDQLGFNVEGSSFTKIDNTDELYGTISSDNFVGKLNDSNYLPTIEDILASFNDSDIEASIVDENGNEVDSSALISTKMKLIINKENTTVEYNFMVKADLDDGLVNSNEVNALIDNAIGLEELDAIENKVIDINEDGVIDILDITKIIGSINMQNWLEEQVSSDSVKANLSRNNNDIVRVGDIFSITLKLSGFENDFVNGLEGIINYNKEELSLVGISLTDSLSEYSNINYYTSKFINAGQMVVSSDSDVMVLTFKALKDVTTTISIKDLKGAMDGTLISILNNDVVTLDIEEALSNNNDIIELNPSTGSLDKEFNKDIYEYTLYVDASVNSITLDGILGDEYASTIGFREYKLTGDTTVIYIDVVSQSGNVKTYKINVIKVYPTTTNNENKNTDTDSNLISYNYSTNNYLSKLEIAGYEIDFDKEILEYEITVGSDVDSLDITAVAEVSSSNVRIYGNDSFNEGENIVEIVVTAEDGSTRTYIIKVNKEKDTSVKKSTLDTEKTHTDANNIEKTIIIILIILVVLGLLYLIFKKEDDK